MLKKYIPNILKNRLTYKLFYLSQIISKNFLNYIMEISGKNKYRLILSHLRGIGVRSIEYFPPKTSPLYLKSDNNELPLYLRADGGLAFLVFSNKDNFYNPEIHNFLKTLIQENKSSITFLDIGANIGLITRQLFSQYKNKIESIYCYEPDKYNFNLLKKNLDTNIFNNKNYHLVNAAVGAETKEENIFMNVHNSGDYSLLKTVETVRNKNINYLKKKIQLISIIDECEKWQKNQSKIIWKSDTQGYDETLATMLPISFWKKNVKGAVLEILRVKGKKFDINKFIAILECFKYKAFINNPKQLISANDVLNFLLSSNNLEFFNDGEFTDLILWN